MVTPFGGRPLEPLVATVADLARRFRSMVEAAANDAVRARGHFRLAIPGGSVAAAFLPELSAGEIPWPAVDLFWADERLVPYSSAESNAGAAVSRLLGKPVIETARLHRFPVGPATAGWLDDLTRELASAPLDLVLLGVGEDGHVASLFPGRALDRTAVVVTVDDAPKPPARRLSLGLTTICRARRVVVAAFGGSKAGLVERLVAGPLSALPVAVVLREAAQVELFLDLAAAAPLGR